MGRAVEEILMEESRYLIGEDQKRSAHGEHKQRRVEGTAWRELRGGNCVEGIAR